MPNLKPVFIVVKNNVEYDYSSYVREFNIQHEEVDDETSGRDVKTGTMIRSRIASKHTITVTLIPIAHATLYELFTKIYAYGYSPTEQEGEGDESETVMRNSNPFFTIKILSPCYNAGRSTDDYETITVYTSTINYGAQRYNRATGTTYYDGVSFKMIQK